MSDAWDAEPYQSGDFLSAEDAEAIAGRPNGAFLLLDACREGRIDADTADDAIDKVRGSAIGHRRGGSLLMALGTVGAVAALVGGLSKSIPVIAAALIVAGATWAASAIEKIQWL